MNMKKTYMVRKISDEGNEGLWIDEFPWYEKGDKQDTRVHLYRDDNGIHVRAICYDRHSSARCTVANGAVYLDSCFEFFFSPFESTYVGNAGVLVDDAARQILYFNIEINCIGTCYFGFGDSRVDERIEVDPKHMQLLDIVVEHNQTSTNVDEHQWIVSYHITYELIDELTRIYMPEYMKRVLGDTIYRSIDTLTISKKSWLANFYRCGGNVDPQYAAWNFIDATFPQFHRPEYFGKLLFGFEPL